MFIGCWMPINLIKEDYFLNNFSFRGLDQLISKGRNGERRDRHLQVAIYHRVIKSILEAGRDFRCSPITGFRSVELHQAM